ncbi:hypothetical protein [Methanoplanus limicola]|uniref:Uncharacterized protein n=1 Tax=Methanoplanus limicola DSM 2279 TaxID=937775 RepID=H1YZJ7_9EURY|nr:hypothetical protein [Methanoplanus limicola]EHQ36106.1 hypothetical protein Metlim_2020 [Methanoplanus limicola DSM 2279]
MSNNVRTPRALAVGVCQSPSEYMQMVSRTEAGRAELSKESSADNISGNISGNGSLNDEAFYSGNFTGNSSDNYSDDGPAGNILGKTDTPDISDIPDMNKAPGSPPEPDESSEEFYSGISASHYPSGIYPSPGYSPKYRAGMVIADRDENLLIVTACNTVTGKYGTRPLLKSTEGDAYLLKDSSFMELGSDYDRFSSIEERYATLYDDLSVKSRESGYNYIKRTGNRIYIRVKENHNMKGYLAPDSAETMKHVII